MHTTTPPHCTRNAPHTTLHPHPPTHTHTTHTHTQGSLTGLALKFATLNAAHYNVTTPVAQPESFVANASFYQMLAAAGVHKIALDCRLTAATPTATTTAGSGVASITVLCEPEPVTATVFIDASYDGEVMVAVGNVDYTAGREAASQYNESLGGARVPTKSSVVVDALRDDGTILKYVQNMSTLAAPGEADDALMAFQHRMCISGDDDRLPWKKPKGYVYNKYIYKYVYIYIRSAKGCGILLNGILRMKRQKGYVGAKKNTRSVLLCARRVRRVLCV